MRCEVRRERGSEMRQCDVSRYLLEILEEFHNDKQLLSDAQELHKLKPLKDSQKPDRNSKEGGTGDTVDVSLRPARRQSQTLGLECVLQAAC